MFDYTNNYESDPTWCSIALKSEIWMTGKYTYQVGGPRLWTAFHTTCSTDSLASTVYSLEDSITLWILACVWVCNLLKPKCMSVSDITISPLRTCAGIIIQSFSSLRQVISLVLCSRKPVSLLYFPYPVATTWKLCPCKCIGWLKALGYQLHWTQNGLSRYIVTMNVRLQPNWQYTFSLQTSNCSPWVWGGTLGKTKFRPLIELVRSSCSKPRLKRYSFVGSVDGSSLSGVGLNSRIWWRLIQSMLYNIWKASNGQFSIVHCLFSKHIFGILSIDPYSSELGDGVPE